MSDKGEAVKILSENPRLINLIQKRPALLSRGPVRSNVLDFTEDVARTLRSREFQVGATTQILTQSVVNLLVQIAQQGVVPHIEKRIQERDENQELPRDVIRDLIPER